MAKQKDTQPVQEVELGEKVNQVVEEKKEVNQAVELVDQVVEKPVEVQEVSTLPEKSKQEEENNSQVRVVRVIQKTPSAYRLLVETGEIVKVSKKDYKKGQEFVTL